MNQSPARNNLQNMFLAILKKICRSACTRQKDYLYCTKACSQGNVHNCSAAASILTINIEKNMIKLNKFNLSDCNFCFVNQRIKYLFYIIIIFY